MTTQATERQMADNDKMVTFQMRCPESWLEQVREQADRFKMSAAAYIRMATQRYMEQDPPEPSPAKRPKR